MDCVWQCKNNKKEANHNFQGDAFAKVFIVFDSAKIIKKKQITTITASIMSAYNCVWQCKNNKKEANHNG